MTLSPLGLPISLLVRLLAWTWQVERPPWPVDGPCVVAFLHGDLVPMVGLHRGLGLVVLASRSRDGALATAALRALGYPTIRGSSSSGGTEALRGAVQALASGQRPAFAVDGPRGPAGIVKPGAEAVARRAGVPVVYGVAAARGFRLRTWDGLLLPWPFARVRIRYGVWRVGEGSLEEGMRMLRTVGLGEEQG
ncbi:MAG: DUF374 domain-containing protein [Pseudomonadota bacterium]|nr:DUF374 domain-containing protein [Pseudomonadota bacterium]